MKAYLWVDGAYRTDPESMSQERAEYLFRKAFGVYMDECYNVFHEPGVVSDLETGTKIVNRAIAKAAKIITGEDQ
jgi:hypothetical protein